jgi:uncharacterized protein YhaN
MRIDQLELIRFGKFSDQTLQFPQSAHDFHVIVGANEAGKSTVRAAVLDLLYGIPVRSTHGFLHGLPELRLGARLRHGEDSLHFHRIKAQRGTLRDPHSGAALPDQALLPYLGASTREFFTKMFGLDHGRLVEGGSSLLSASDDTGRILFQSASGVGGLGNVRQALEQEAEALWTPRRSAQRAFYQAEDALQAASQALKDATVRSSTWVQAHDKVQQLQAELTQARGAHQTLRQRRAVLERIRRVAPLLQALHDAEATLGPLAQSGSAPLLPPDARQTLERALRDMAVAGAALERLRPRLHALQTERDALAADPAVLARADDVTRLHEWRLQYRAHASDIEARQQDVATHARQAALRAADMGWPAGDESALRAQLPSSVLRHELDALVAEAPALHDKQQAAQEAEQARRDELDATRSALAALAPASTPHALQAALNAAHALGAADAQTLRLQQALEQAGRAQAQAWSALGSAAPTVEALRAMLAPAPAEIQRLLQDSHEDLAAQRQLAKRVSDQHRDLAALDLAIDQLRAAHGLVTQDDVLGARGARDATWAQIQAVPAQLTTLAPQLTQQLVAADGLADRRHDTAQQASELQAQTAQRARLARTLQDLLDEQQALEQAAAQRHAHWALLCSQAGLPALPLANAQAWLQARSDALAAADAAQEAAHSLQAHVAHSAQVRVDLAAALQAQTGHAPAGDASLAQLVAQAQQWTTAEAARAGTREALAQQLRDGEQALQALARASAKAGAAVQSWQQRWQQALASTGWPTNLPMVRAQAWLQSAEQIDAALRAMDRIRVEHIDTMQADLRQFAQLATELAQALAPALLPQPAPETALALHTRLQQAQAAAEQRSRLQREILATQEQLGQADSAHALALASLAPLLQQAGVDQPEALEPAIAAAEAQRQQRAQRDALLDQLQRAGDGLPRAQLHAEVAAMDLGLLAAELEQVQAQDQALVERQSQLTADLAAADTALRSISGAADAATAEAQRQEALARMTDVVERYVKVATGARLLKWSIERYRELKQGPMLQTASQIFATLTNGSFERLSVDFEHEPPTLVGKRADGQSVEPSGMSDGTRDQLYLALRLAALQMHLQQAHQMPFIADDLFINYDDARSAAGLRALRELSRHTQVIFLTHHDHLLPSVRQVFGEQVNVVSL